MGGRCVHVCCGAERDRIARGADAVASALEVGSEMHSQAPLGPSASAAALVIARGAHFAVFSKEVYRND